jgi:hypothetical protein
MAEQEQGQRQEPHNIDSESDIPDLCKSLFLTKEKFLSIIWIVAGLLLAGGGGCIAWAMATNSSIVELKSKQGAQDNRMEYLDAQINKKLDELLKRHDEK